MEYLILTTLVPVNVMEYTHLCRQKINFFVVCRRIYCLVLVASYKMQSSVVKRRPAVHGGAAQILADQLNLSQPGGADYARHIITGTPGFSDLPTALKCT